MGSPFRIKFLKKRDSTSVFPQFFISQTKVKKSSAFTEKKLFLSIFHFQERTCLISQILWSLIFLSFRMKFNYLNQSSSFPLPKNTFVTMSNFRRKTKENSFWSWSLCVSILVCIFKLSEMKLLLKIETLPAMYCFAFSLYHFLSNAQYSYVSLSEIGSDTNQVI